MKPSGSWKGTWSRFFKTIVSKAGNPPAIENGTVVETPELYLKLTKKCIKRMNKLLSFALKFNQEQCIYLANKLHIALKCAHSIIEQINIWYSSTSSDDMSKCLETFKLLFLMGLEVEDFIQNCYKDGWIQSAFMLGNVSERIGSIAFNLEFCSIIFLERKLERFKSFTFLEIANLHQKEASIVKEKATLDEMKLFVDLGNVMPNSSQWQLATFLLGRLKSVKLQPGVGLPTSHDFSHSNLSMRTLKQMESLGKGASATVYRSIWLGVEVAKKTFDGPSNPDFLQEVSILAALSHPNIVSLLWYMIDQRKSHIIMELMDQDLRTFMQTRLEENRNRDCPFSISEALDLMLQTAEGMLFLHEMRIVHRDLKSSNILVKCGKAVESNFEYVQAKVADFGLSRTKELSMTYSQQSQNMGTTRWMAPEMIKFGDDDGQAKKKVPKYPFKSDVYSFGMVCFEILTGDLPFSSVTNSEVKKKVLSGGRPQLPDKCPNKLKTLIEACWNSEASIRPHFGDICAELRHLKCEHLTSCSTTSSAREYLFTEVLAATENYKSIIGRGGFGPVYYGKFPDGKEVAVKVLDKTSRQGQSEFFNEVEVLSRVHHKYVVALVGYCQTPNQHMLIYEYLHKGSLRDHLDGNFTKTGSRVLDWKTRLNIALQAAQGLEFLHTGCNPKLIHRDVKSSNILITSKYKAKVADFGLAHLGGKEDDTKVLTNVVKGTIGYLDPEYYLTQYISAKSDVYSFGVVLLELLTGRLPFERTIPNEMNVNICNWVRESLKQDNIDVILDADVRASDPNYEALWKVVEIALQSVEPKSIYRPTMKEVVQELYGAMALEDKASNPNISMVLPSPHQQATSGAREFSLAEVVVATENYKKVIGNGGFGLVYYGRFPDGKEVAVKELDKASHQGQSEFSNEVNIRSRVHHKHLVAFVGYCQTQNQQMLIYEYLRYGSLRDHLDGDFAKTGSRILDWKTRLNIALQTAQGLEYLHVGCDPSLIHRDVNSNNILITSKYEAKVTNFGMSRLVGEEDTTTLLTFSNGSTGYVDPEYYLTQFLSTKSDVYGFGMVLLELLTGRRPIDRIIRRKTNQYLCDWVRSSLKQGNINMILDVVVRGSCPNHDALWKVAKIAMQSIEPKSVNRPTMNEVVQELYGAMVLEDKTSNSNSGMVLPSLPQHDYRCMNSDYSGYSRSSSF